jgi:hypothetical protein
LNAKHNELERRCVMIMMPRIELGEGGMREIDRRERSKECITHSTTSDVGADCRFYAAGHHDGCPSSSADAAVTKMALGSVRLSRNGDELEKS